MLQSLRIRNLALLEEVALDFEASHPTLAGTVGSIIDALARMGI